MPKEGIYFAAVGLTPCKTLSAKDERLSCLAQLFNTLTGSARRLTGSICDRQVSLLSTDHLGSRMVGSQCPRGGYSPIACQLKPSDLKALFTQKPHVFCGLSAQGAVQNRWVGLKRSPRIYDENGIRAGWLFPPRDFRTVS